MHYRDYSTYLKETYGEKVYKLPISLSDAKCPNRDGSISFGGCSFCDASGSGFQCLPSEWTITAQLTENRDFYHKRFGAEKFIAYLQSYTNTYLPFSRFQEVIEEICAFPDLVGIAISTRPDCVNEQYLSYLSHTAQSRKLDIDIELGLQTVNYRTLAAVNRGHSLAEYIDAVIRIKKYHLTTTAHIILNLPGDEMIDVIETAKILSALDVDAVKLHSLYIVGGTALAKSYVRGEFEVISPEDYIERAVTFLEYLHKDVVIQRLVGKGPKDNLIFGNWDSSWWKIKDAIEDELIRKNSYQGKKCDYLNGHALKF